MIVSVLHVFHETTLKRRIDAMLETRVISLLETANFEATKSEKTTVYYGFKKIIHPFTARSAIDEATYRMVNKLAESLEFVQHLSLESIKNLLFELLITHFSRMHP